MLVIGMRLILLTTASVLSNTLALKSAGTTHKGTPFRHELPTGAISATQDVVKNHELPQRAQKADPWSTKIPDININLALAQEWMTTSKALTASTGKAAAHAPLPTGTLFGAKVDGAMSMVAGDVADAPKYYDCGLRMNTAWSSMARDPCSMATWSASDKMKEVVLKCSKLRVGKDYAESYRALKIDQDTWCGAAPCDPKCVEGVKCARTFEFPFSPKCASYPNVTAAVVEEKVEEPKVGMSWAMDLTCGAMLLICVGFACVPRPKAKAPRREPIAVRGNF